MDLVAKAWPLRIISPYLSSAFLHGASCWQVLYLGLWHQRVSSPRGKRLPLSQLFQQCLGSCFTGPAEAPCWSLIWPQGCRALIGRPGACATPVMGERAGLCKSQVRREFGEEPSQEKSRGLLPGARQTQTWTSTTQTWEMEAQTNSRLHFSHVMRNLGLICP